MTAEFAILPPDFSARREVPSITTDRTPPLPSLATIAVEFNITEFFNAGPTNRALALEAAEENRIAFQRSVEK